MFKLPLHKNWTVRAVGDLADVPPDVRGKEIPAAVPGCVHTDLLGAGLIADPFLDRNENSVQWIGRTDWRYACTFDVDQQILGHERIDLVCEGLDTIATIELNGQGLGQTANMHHSHRFDCRGRLRVAGNELVITFASALRHAQAMEAKFGLRPHVEKHPFNYIRKMACNFGWDWGPTLITAGIWRPIGIEVWNGARIVGVRPLVRRADAEGASVEVVVDVEAAGGMETAGGGHGGCVAPPGLGNGTPGVSGFTPRPTHCGGPPALAEGALTLIAMLVAPDGREFGASITVTLGAGDGPRVGPSGLTESGTDGTTGLRPWLLAGATSRLSTPCQLRFDVPNPQLWWPRGHGAQPLYDLTVALTQSGIGVPPVTGASVADAQGSYERREADPNVHHRQDAGATVAELDRWSGRIGLRTVRLNTDKDPIGSKFQIEVNGKPIFCKGANWIPDDCFPHRVTPGRYRGRLQQAVDANMNMLRVWGGGIYESDTFYDLCDEMGLLIWQDFLFACAAYPEEEPYRTLVEAEARYNVARLSRHASLVLWNGCNENIWGYFDWGWRLLLTPLRRTWGLGFYTGLLPKLVAEIDPTRPYWPGSPYSGSMDIHPLDANHGTTHIWDAWNREDYTVYRRYTPRFCSEFGHQAPPTWATLTRAIPADQLHANAPAMLHHQKARRGQEKLEARLREHFVRPTSNEATKRPPERDQATEGAAGNWEQGTGNSPNLKPEACSLRPDAFHDWLYLTQLNQARAMTLGVEWFRSRSPVCMGTLYWQLNDCWPGTSWSCIDGDGRRKPLWYATRRFYADRLLTIQPEPAGELVLHAINDTDRAWQGGVCIVRMDFTGRELEAAEVVMDVAPRSRRRLGTLRAELAMPGDAARECIVVKTTGATAGDALPALWFFDIDRNLAYPAPTFDAALTCHEGAYELTITAKVLLRDVALFVDRLDPAAEASDQLVTMLPGESFTFRFRSALVVTREALLSPPVFQCANRFGRKPV